MDLKQQPWYKTVKDRKSRDDDDKTEVDLKRKQTQDPLNTINSLHKNKKKKEDKEKEHKKKSKSSSSSSLNKSDMPKQPKTIEQLRAERFV